MQRVKTAWRGTAVRGGCLVLAEGGSEARRPDAPRPMNLELLTSRAPIAGGEAKHCGTLHQHTVSRDVRRAVDRAIRHWLGICDNPRTQRCGRRRIACGVLRAPARALQ